MANISSLKDIMEHIKAPPDISLDCTAVNKGIDNYHTDVEISAAFTFRVKESIEQNLKRLVSGKSLLSGNSETMVELREAYTDLMKVTFHRSKTDLTVGQISVLQFGLVKFVIQEIRDALDRYREQLEETLGQQQYAGSRSLMATQEKVSWYRQHNTEFAFRLTRLYLRQLQREENNQLKGLREQILGDSLPEAANIMYNPLLYSRSPRDPLLLLDYYAIWPGGGTEFDKLNQALEAGFGKHFPEKQCPPLKSTEKLTSAQTEVYDELGGLFAAQMLLGPTEDQKEVVNESLGWLEHPGNIRLLFDEKIHERHLENAKEHLGFGGQWSFKGGLKKLVGIAQKLRKSAADSKVLKTIVASYSLREKLTQPDLDLIDVEDALNLVSGSDSRKIHEVIDLTEEGGAALQAKLEDCIENFEELWNEAGDELFLKLLTDYSRYRLHLKYYRFAHRVFNRLSIITDPEKIQLAKAGGNLYRLLTADEVKDVVSDDLQPEIAHHTILKADVRGSTTLTSQLTTQGLNPASFFSLRFFNPINERLGIYGAVKVFIEGDAVILGLYEFDGSPDQWFSVSRACGIAKEMLDIVASSNTHSKQTGLPVLEIGIGICYRDDRPLFLFDDNRPIMISSAIGKADRMSGCSWRLREHFDAGNFNVGAFEMAEGQSDKGQELIRYNVNGIVLDDAAWEKLKSEVHFKRIQGKSGDETETFYVGQYPDIQGKERDLVVREGKVGVWRDDSIGSESGSGRFFYEVLPNNKFANQIVELASKKAS